MMKERIKESGSWAVPGLANVLLMSSDPDSSVTVILSLGICPRPPPSDSQASSLSGSALTTANPLTLAPACSGSSCPAIVLVGESRGGSAKAD